MSYAYDYIYICLIYVLCSYIYLYEHGTFCFINFFTNMRIFRCIFIWRLPSDMRKIMRTRLEELGKIMDYDEQILDLQYVHDWCCKKCFINLYWYLLS